jgi:hypothetical protein
MPKVRIQAGALIFQDFRTFHWPACIPPHSHYADEPYQFRAKDPHMVFEGEKKERYWDCRADGYGQYGNGNEYGSGSIFVYGLNGVVDAETDEPIKDDKAE